MSKRESQKSPLSKKRASEVFRVKQRVSQESVQQVPPGIPGQIVVRGGHPVSMAMHICLRTLLDHARCDRVPNARALVCGWVEDTFHVFFPGYDFVWPVGHCTQYFFVMFLVLPFRLF